MTNARTGMNPQQLQFADEYCIDSNGTQAAIRAGYAPQSATLQAYKLLKRPDIANYIRDKKQTLSDKLGITAEYILSGAMHIAEKTKPIRHEPDAKTSLKAFELLG